MIEENKVYIRDLGKFSYPTSFPFNPSIGYPEYEFGEINLNEKNEIYNGIREIFHSLELDAENYNSPSWNPLGYLIKPGNTVVLKPNLVMHENGIKLNGIECLITHGSIIRAMVDYVYKALRGNGRIIIGDAALQRCDFDKVVASNGIIDIINFYKNHNFTIELIDFRTEKVVLDSNSNIIGVKQINGDPSGYTAVDLKDKSMLYEIIDKYKDFRVTSYNPNLMKSHHNSDKNEYCIPNIILQADVIINLPKPKTHRKAGITGAMKNLVGINGNKDWLPHHRRGEKEIGGDEYLYTNIFKKINASLQEKIDVSTIERKYEKKVLFRLTQQANSILRKATSKDTYKEGSWWGNDTIWRTLYDLNIILMYADKNGNIQNKRQRKYISLLDMVISGEGEGPLLPSPKSVGLLIFGINPLAIDAVVVNLMGFDYQKIPSVYKGFNAMQFPIFTGRYRDIKILSNNESFNCCIENIKSKDTFGFKPTEGWSGHIELDYN